MAAGVEQELKDAVERVLRSESRKKLVVAGPGAGKTTLFKQLLGGTPGGPDERLVLTFINNLKTDLERGLGDLARVFTLHGYCQSLFHRYGALRHGLTGNFVCFPGLVTLIKTDWEWLKGSDPPAFFDLMRRLECPPEKEQFYVARANVYDAVDFDDSVYRTYQALNGQRNLVPEYRLILIDEFQDFNRMEAGIISLLAERNPITIAGDDDQALYGQLRGASWDHIRELHDSGEYEVFNLPFCMRCPEVIVSAVSDVLNAARKLKKMAGRIEKPFRFYEPKKGKDSKRFPVIDYVVTSVQRTNANYFGKYIERSIRSIPEEELREAAENFEAAAMIIGSNPYRGMVERHLVDCGLLKLSDLTEQTNREKALELLHADAHSNLGWRIVLAEEKETLAKSAVVDSSKKGGSLVDFIPAYLREEVLQEARAYAEARALQADADKGKDVCNVPAVKMTSFEGAKGLSAQYVFLVGVHENELPKHKTEPTDLEICRFLVGLTRTKKKCSVLTTKRFGEDFKKPSVFLSWIDVARFGHISISADSFK